MLFVRYKGTINIALLFLLVIDKVANGISVEKDLTLTSSERNALQQFRGKVSSLLYKDFMKHDIYLIRWLRARNFDVQSAEAMFRTHLKWRTRQKMDTILEEDWSDMLRDYPVTIDTHDKEGRPVGVIDIYDWDIRTGVLQGKSKRGLRYLEYLMENATMQVFEQQAKGLNVTQWKVLGNAEGFNLISHGCPICLPLWIQLAQDLEQNYVGWLDELIVVEAPPTISVVLEAVRPFLSQQTRQALKIFGLNKRKWLPYLEERISKDQRRPQYGGTLPRPKYN